MIRLLQSQSDIDHFKRLCNDPSTESVGPNIFEFVVDNGIDHTLKTKDIFVLTSPTMLGRFYVGVDDLPPDLQQAYLSRGFN